MKELRGNPMAGATEVADRRGRRGTRAYHAGLAAEDRIAMDYERRGYQVADRRWRGGGGEIDLVLRDGDGLVFVEVKQARTFDRAADSLRPEQVRRIFRAAECYVAGEPAGQLTEMRFDLGLVDGQGCVQVMENALWAA